MLSRLRGSRADRTSSNGNDLFAFSVTVKRKQIGDTQAVINSGLPDGGASGGRYPVVPSRGLWLRLWFAAALTFLFGWLGWVGELGWLSGVAGLLFGYIVGACLVLIVAVHGLNTIAKQENRKRKESE